MMSSLELVFVTLLHLIVFSQIGIQAQTQPPSSSYGYPSPTFNYSPSPNKQFLDYVKSQPPYPVSIAAPAAPTLYSRNSVNTGPGPICRGQLIGDEYKYICTGSVPTLSRKYILWLQSGRTRPISIEIPNYKLDDWIEAGFKRGREPSRSRINLFVKKPEISAHASAEETAPVEPDVHLEYEPVLQTTRHFGTDEVRIVGPGVIQEPQQFGSSSDGRQQIQYKRETKSQEQAPEREPAVTVILKSASPAAPSPMKVMTAPVPMSQKVITMPSGMWYPISGPNGHRLQF